MFNAEKRYLIALLMEEQKIDRIQSLTKLKFYNYDYQLAKNDNKIYTFKEIQKINKLL